MKQVFTILLGAFCFQTIFSQDQPGVITVRKEIKIDSLFCIAPIMPSFKGGDSQFMSFLNKNINYPGMQEGKKGRVQFVVPVSFKIK